MTTLLQRNKCNFWHLQKLFMWVWVQSWKKQEGCGDSTCGINCNHKRWIILSPLYLYSNHFTKSRPDNKNSNFPGIRHLLFWSFTRWQTPPPAVAVQRGGASSIIRQYSESWSNNCKLYNFRVLQCWQKCMLGNAFSKFTISIKLWHSKEIVLVGPFLLYCVNQKFKNSIVRIIFKTFKEW